MDISLAGIEEALKGLDYRSDKSPKSRLVRAIHSFYEISETPDAVRSIDSDELIDLMWNLEGDVNAVRSKHKNLSSIKSSVNQDLEAAWEDGRNPEGITIGPQNTFVMSDAAKDKILNSFSGSVNLKGGNSLDRVAEALKIVSEYLSDIPPGVEGEQLANLKSLIEGLSEKFREGGDSQFELTGKKGDEFVTGGVTDVDTAMGEPHFDGSGADAGAVEMVDEGELDVEEVDEVVEIVDEENLEGLEKGIEREEAPGEDAFGNEVAEAEGESDELEFVDEDDVIKEVVDEPAEEEIGVESDETAGDKADEVELVDEDDLIEGDIPEEAADEVEEVLEDDIEEISDDEETPSAPDDKLNDVGLPIDQLMEDAMNFEEFQLDENQKRLLAERFDGYLGAMERYYNQYIFIKKGSYPVGANLPDSDVLPRQQVLLSDYYMGKYPVTNALFEVFIERTGYKTTAEKLGYGYVYHGRFRKVVDPKTGFTSSVWNATYTKEKVKGASWYQPLGPGSTLHQKRNHPVVQVSVRDARTFAAWTGKRLPTEIEWEAAARTQTGFTYPWGNDWIEGFCNLENSGISDTCPVDHFPHSVNEEGLADFLGNVMEWTADECEPKFPLETPTRFFIAKGGSWVSPEQTHLYDRSRFEADFTANILGFRCLAD